ncbi:DUF6969 family protein [Pelagibacterium montanilacus]|uniref:DUF6969 family protein n=1 Tax=Pelagibacterium montanilacus TaxID=2185280 RepID=UPI000F8C4F9C|nr:hypothetical protein [Pelagibacterium montanilacus]
MSEDRDLAMREIALCETVLAKGGLTVVTETLRDAGNIATWAHYPEGDVFDPATGAQWFYHCHPVPEGETPLEHGHFHCFVRPDGREGPIHHLIAIGVDPYGRLVRLFTVNQWVVGDDWLDAAPTIALLGRFDVHMPRPSYLVNRWLTAVIAAYQTEIADLIARRDRTLAGHTAPEGTAVREDKALEVTSEFIIPAS